LSWNPCRIGSGRNEALAEKVEAKDEPNGGDFFRLIVSFSAFLSMNYRGNYTKLEQKYKGIKNL
jgi:hypothetical protein